MSAATWSPTPTQTASTTGNDDFGARYYSNRFGRWLSADWSAVPVPVPYANLGNPQTLNLYAMVADDPESFAHVDGHNAMGLPSGSPVTINGTEEYLNHMGTQPVSDPAAELSRDAAEEAAAQASAQQVRMTVEIDQEPQVFENKKIEGADLTIIGAILKIILTDSNGKPLANVPVAETNIVFTPGAKVNEATVPKATDKNGVIYDIVGKGGPAKSAPPNVKEFFTTHVLTFKSTQTLTFDVGKTTHKITWTRTLTNVRADGELSKSFNSHGVNYAITWTTPDIK